MKTIAFMILVYIAIICSIGFKVTFTNQNIIAKNQKHILIELKGSD